MLVCNCNRITEQEVDAAVERGAKCWKEIHAYFGCQPCCGMCECEMADAIECAGACNTAVEAA